MKQPRKSGFNALSLFETDAKTSMLYALIRNEFD
jgi:hypothetical protein